MQIEYFIRSLPCAPKGEGRLERNNNIVYSKITSGSVLNKLVQLNRITQEDLGVDLLPLGNFSNFSEKNSKFSTIWNKFHMFSEPFEKTKLIKFNSYLKEINLLSPLPPYL